MAKDPKLDPVFYGDMSKQETACVWSDVSAMRPRMECRSPQQVINAAILLLVLGVVGESEERGKKAADVIDAVTNCIIESHLAFEAWDAANSDTGHG